MYKTLVRPHFEYAAPVWDPHRPFKGHRICGECAKIWTKNVFKRWDLGYQELLHLTQIPTLENRKIYLKLCTLFKIIHGLFSFTPDVFMPQPNRHDYIVSPYCINPMHTLTPSFIPSTISIWKHLPHDALIAPSLRTFKMLHLCSCNLIIRVHTCISLGSYYVSIASAQIIIEKKKTRTDSNLTFDP